MFLQLCWPCAAGTYNTQPGSVCKPCPDGAMCSGGAHIAALRDHWQLGDTFHKCNSDHCCSSVSALDLITGDWEGPCWMMLRSV